MEEHITEVNEEVVEEVNPKTFTQEEVDKLLQSESDKRVTSALAKAKEKWADEYKVAQEEAEKLASLSQEERIQAELAKEKEEFEKEKNGFQKAKMEMQTIKELGAERLPVELASFVVADTAEEVSNNIKVFKEVWEKAINDAVSSRLTGRIPTEQNTDSAVTTMSKSDFASLPFKKREALLKADPDLLKKLK